MRSCIALAAVAALCGCGTSYEPEFRLSCGFVDSRVLPDFLSGRRSCSISYACQEVEPVERHVTAENGNATWSAELSCVDDGEQPRTSFGCTCTQNGTALYDFRHHDPCDLDQLSDLSDDCIFYER